MLSDVVTGIEVFPIAEPVVDPTIELDCREMNAPARSRRDREADLDEANCPGLTYSINQVDVVSAAGSKL